MKRNEQNMMKRRIKSNIQIIGLAACMALVMNGCRSGADSSANHNSDMQTEEAQETGTTEEEAASTVDVNRKSLMEHDKEESVYVLADAYGAPDEIMVTATLKNPGGKTSITDYTTLQDIRNKEGDEEYTLSADGTLTWENHGADIQYEGTAERELPLSVRVSYYLNDKEVTAEEIAGATGAVRIRFDYTNHTEDENGIVPFTVISGMMLQEEVAANIEVTNGKVKEVDGNYLIIGCVMPGVKEALALDELETFEEKDDNKDEADEEVADDEKQGDIFDNFIEVSFDAVDFELEFTATLMMNGILSDIDMEEISEQVDDLADGFDSLNNGVWSLTDALRQLDESGDALVSGATELQTNLESLNAMLSQLPPEVLEQDPTLAQLAAAIAALSTGSGQLTEGITAYTDGVGQVYEGSRSLNNATYQLTETADDLQTAMQRIEDLQAADNAYENYSGIAEGRSGSVIFIVETAEISATTK